MKSLQISAVSHVCNPIGSYYGEIVLNATNESSFHDYYYKLLFRVKWGLGFVLFIAIYFLGSVFTSNRLQTFYLYIASWTRTMKVFWSQLPISSSLATSKGISCYLFKINRSYNLREYQFGVVQMYLHLIWHSYSAYILTIVFYISLSSL